MSWTADGQDEYGLQLQVFQVLLFLKVKQYNSKLAKQVGLVCGLKTAPLFHSSGPETLSGLRETGSWFYQVTFSKSFLLYF